MNQPRYNQTKTLRFRQFTRKGWALHVYVEANNLFGCRYVDYGNVPQPGQWLMVGVRYSQ